MTGEIQMVDTKEGKIKGSKHDKPISLKPLKFDEAVSDLLKVKPKNKNTKHDDKDKCQP